MVLGGLRRRHPAAPVASAAVRGCNGSGSAREAGPCPAREILVDGLLRVGFGVARPADRPEVAAVVLHVPVGDAVAAQVNGFAGASPSEMRQFGLLAGLAAWQHGPDCDAEDRFAEFTVCLPKRRSGGGGYSRGQRGKLGRLRRPGQKKEGPRRWRGRLPELPGVRDLGGDGFTLNFKKKKKKKKKNSPQTPSRGAAKSDSGDHQTLAAPDNAAMADSPTDPDRAAAQARVLSSPPREVPFRATVLTDRRAAARARSGLGGFPGWGLLGV